MGQNLELDLRNLVHVQWSTDSLPPRNTKRGRFVLQQASAWVIRSVVKQVEAKDLPL